MNSMNDSGIVAGLASGQTSHTHRLRGLAVTGFIAALAAMGPPPSPLRLPKPLASTSRSPMVAKRSRCPGSPW